MGQGTLFEARAGVVSQTVRTGCVECKDVLAHRGDLRRTSCDFSYLVARPEHAIRVQVLRRLKGLGGTKVSAPIGTGDE
jgi:hypothetical protein